MHNIIHSAWTILTEKTTCTSYRTSTLIFVEDFQYWQLTQCIKINRINTHTTFLIQCHAIHLVLQTMASLIPRLLPVFKMPKRWTELRKRVNSATVYIM